MPFYREHTRTNKATGRKEKVKVLYLRWPDSTGKWHKCPAAKHGIEDIKSARAWEAARKVEAAGNQHEPAREVLSLGFLMEAYFDEKVAADQPTERYVYAMRALMKVIPHTTLLEEVGPSDVRAYVQRREEIVSAGTIIKELNCLSAAWNWALRNGWQIPRNPVSGNKPRPPRHREVFITKEQAAALVQAARESKQAPYLAPAIILAINCGLRQGELEGLEWGHIGLDTRVIKLPAENDSEEGTRRAKTQRERWIPYNQQAHEALLELHAMRKNHSRWVLCHQWHKKNREIGDRVKNLKKAFALARKRAGLPEWATMHVVFRHSPGSWMYQDGEPLQNIAEFLRQSELSVTEMYAHLGERKKREIYAGVGFSVP